MKKAYRPIFVAIAAACLLGAFVPVASAYPSKTVRCDTADCHDAGAGATVSASLVSTSATTATYDLAMTGSAGSAWAVFDGSNRLFDGTTATGAFTVDLGKTYDLMAVNATVDSSSSKLATNSVSPAAPSIEPTAPPVSLDESTPPVTTSDALGSYPGAAKVKLTATDGAGQGVAYIYYSLDGDRVHLFTVGINPQTTVDIAAPAAGKNATHTITFWSQDNAGNVEAVKSATFTVAGAALPPVVTPPVVTPPVVTPPVVKPPVVSPYVGKRHATLTTPAAPSTVYARHWFKVTGYITRHTSGSHAVQLRFYRYKNGHYAYYKTVRPAVYNSMFREYSRYSAKTTLKYKGRWRIRAVHSDSLHLTTYSKYEYLRVK